jgi:hypothetical protein
MLPLTLMGGSATELSVTGSCHDRGGDKVRAPSQSWALVNIAQFSNLFLFGTSPGLAKAGNRAQWLRGAAPATSSGHRPRHDYHRKR